MDRRHSRRSEGMLRRQTWERVGMGCMIGLLNSPHGYVRAACMSAADHSAIHEARLYPVFKLQCRSGPSGFITERDLLDANAVIPATPCHACC